MNHELKVKWIEALESGNFSQITGTLRRDEGHCCLGVLCEVAEIPITPGYESEAYSKLRQLGIPRDDFTNLWHMNDGVWPARKKHTFQEIANHVRVQEW